MHAQRPAIRSSPLAKVRRPVQGHWAGELGPPATVQDILERADVGCSTFYAHYRDHPSVGGYLADPQLHTVLEIDAASGRIVGSYQTRGRPHDVVAARWVG